jgi:hypothetical protein
MKVSIQVTAVGKNSRFDYEDTDGYQDGKTRRVIEATNVLACLPVLLRSVWDTYYPQADVEKRVKALEALAEKMGLSDESRVKAPTEDVKSDELYAPGKRLLGTDAHKWAEAMELRLHSTTLPEDMSEAVTEWFANAIEAGRSAGIADGRAELEEAIADRDRWKELAVKRVQERDRLTLAVEQRTAERDNALGEFRRINRRLGEVTSELGNVKQRRDDVLKDLAELERRNEELMRSGVMYRTQLQALIYEASAYLRYHTEEDEDSPADVQMRRTLETAKMCLDRSEDSDQFPDSIIPTPLPDSQALTILRNLTDVVLEWTTEALSMTPVDLATKRRALKETADGAAAFLKSAGVVSAE